MKIIGVEFRLQFHDPKVGPQQREIGIVPCEIEAFLKRSATGDYWYGNITVNLTIHTDRGDINVGGSSVPDSWLVEEPGMVRIEAKQHSPSSPQPAK
jgi:hypothetical protein